MIEIATGNEIEVLADEFNKMAGEIKNAYQGLEDKVQQRTKELTALLDVAATATQSFDIDVVLRQVAEKISEIFELYAVLIYLYEPNQTDLRVRALTGYAPQEFAQKLFKRGQGIVGRVADTGEPLLFADAQSDPAYLAASQSQAAKELGIHFFAGFPIKSKGRVLGAIVCNGRLPRQLTEPEHRLLTSMADRSARPSTTLTCLTKQKVKAQSSNGAIAK